MEPEAGSHAAAASQRTQRLLASLPAAAPSSSVPAEVAARFSAYMQATEAGYNFTSALRSKKAFGNPYLLEETIATFGMDDTGSALPARAWDASALPPGDFSDALALRQALEEEVRKAKQSERSSVAFEPPSLPMQQQQQLLSGGSSAAYAPAAAAAAAAAGSSSEGAGALRKKSRFADR
jgi:hypothetical protein